MKISVLGAVLAIGVLGSTVSGFAAGGKAERLMPVDFGPVMTMKVGGHEMHVQGIQDEQGGQWVVMSREDAESLLGTKMADTQFTKVHIAH